MIRRASTGDENDALELNLALGAEVHLGLRLRGVLGYGLVEGGVLLILDVLGVARPDGLLLVDVLPLGHLLLHRLRLGLVVLLLVLLVVRHVHLVVLLLLLLGLLLLGVLALLLLGVLGGLLLLLHGNLLRHGLGLVEVDGEVD